MSVKVQQGIETKNNMLKFARSYFADVGYHGARFDEVAKNCNVTTGALYHHFKNKRNLFELVFIQCAEEVAEKIVKKAANFSNILEGIVEGSMVFIKETIAPDKRRIMLEDALSVLGLMRWKEIDTTTSEQGLLEAVKIAMEQGEIDSSLSPRALTRFISGGINDLTLWVSQSKNKKQALSQSRQILTTLLHNLGGKK